MALDYRYSNATKGETILAIQDAICSSFDASDWQKFGYQTDNDDLITGHRRLLRSLHWGDPDYETCVFDILEHLYELDSSAFTALLMNEKVEKQLKKKYPDLLSKLGLLDEHVPPVQLKQQSAGEVVEVALQDAENLLHTSGPLSAVDRLHTALHGYVKHLCTQASIPFAEDASITALFKSLRLHHPNFNSLTGSPLEKVLQGFGNALDAINTMRNRNSVAHPNEELLGEDEALFVVNAVRTMFHYLHAKAGR